MEIAVIDESSERSGKVAAPADSEQVCSTEII